MIPTRQGLVGRRFWAKYEKIKDKTKNSKISVAHSISGPKIQAESLFA